MTVDTLDEPRLRRLIAVGRSFVQELDPEALLTNILVAAQELTGARYAALGVLDADREQLARFLTRGIDPVQQQAIGDLPHGRGILGVLIDEPEPLRLDDLHKHPRSFGFPASHPPMTSFLGVPILVRGVAWGNIYLTEKENGPFDAADEEALIILADWAAVAVDNARVHAEVQTRNDKLQRMNRVLAATTSIAHAMGSETDLERVLELIVKRGRALVEAGTMFISLAQEDEQLVIAAAAGDQGPSLPGTRVPLAGSTAGEVLRDGHPRRVRADRLSFSPAQLGIPGMTNCLLVPLVFRGRSLGVLFALDRVDAEATFSGEDEELLLAFAASAATAVATAQDVSENRLRDILDSAERERRRWARELHDETLQGLAGLQLLLSIAEQQSRDESTSAKVRDVLDALGSEIGKLRTLITELRPAALDELGLRPALESLARAVSTTSGLEVDLRVDLQDERLSGELETAVYRVAQEGLTNVMKHADAVRCILEVAHNDGAVDITVRDDGRGIDEGALARRNGFGVTGMRERARLEGGSLTLGPGAAGGTELRVQLPLPPPPSTFRP